MNLPVVVETVQTTQLEAPKVIQIEAPKEAPKEPEPLPEQINTVNLMDRLLAEKTKAQKEKVTAGAIKRGWITETQTYRELPISIQTQATAFPERFFASFAI